MRRVRHRPGIRLPLLGAAIVAVLLSLFAAPSAGAGEGGSYRYGSARAAVRAHEKARMRVERLRNDRVPAARVRAAERRRKAIRSLLWNRLRAKQRAVRDPVAVDSRGRRGGCAVKRLKRVRRTAGVVPSFRGRRDDSWTAPIRHYRLSARYGARGGRWAHRHTGQDFAVPTGTPVYAVGPGTVRATTCGDGFGNQIVVRHRDGYFTQYAHLSRIYVRRGQRVVAGQRIGLSGASGNVTGPHLHFEVRITPYMGSDVAPLTWLRRKHVRVAGVPGK
ncbi:M23 family metallopeptidase [Streptomyces sp. HUAS ZL42]|uniref:M23 family metallopeptidase n=1 Tax=Streptomyces sp. HUAS ZL42 TaxID=3231715 RepID=UPI00345E1F08